MAGLIRGRRHRSSVPQLRAHFRERFLLRRNVVAAVLSGGHPDAVAKEFGVSRASVYNWVREFKEAGAAKLVHADGDKRISRPGSTPFDSIRLIRELALRNPTLSADQIAKKVNVMDWWITPRTIRNIFKRMGMSAASERVSKRALLFSADMPKEELSDEDMEILDRLDALPPGELKGSLPGEVLVQDRVKFPKGFCDQPLALELIVDTFAPMKRIYASLASPTDQLSVDALSRVHAAYKDEYFKIHKVCAPRKQQYADDLGAIAYPKWFKKHLEQVLEVRPANSKTADSRIKGAWSFLKSEWLKALPTRSASQYRHPKQIDDDLQVWLAAHLK